MHDRLQHLGLPPYMLHTYESLLKDHLNDVVAIHSSGYLEDFKNFCSMEIIKFNTS